MKDEIAKLDEVIGKVLAYGPSRKNVEKRKAAKKPKRVKKRKSSA